MAPFSRPGAGFLSLVCLLALLTGCAGAGGPVRGGVLDGAPPVTMISPATIAAERVRSGAHDGARLGSLLVAAPPSYTMGAGDIVAIVVWDHPELSPLAPAGSESAPGFVLDHEGQIQFPYAGKLTLAGLTEQQARALLAARLARVINRPDVTVRVQAYRSQRIYIDGEVKAPGMQAINDIPMTLAEALSRAGGLLASADQSRLTLERAGQVHRIDLLQLVQQGINPSQLLLLHGDVLRVPSRDESKVFVSGEVVTPKALTMHNGRLSLNEALGEAGGVSPLTGDQRQVYVVRRAADGPRVFQLDAGSAGALAMAEDFELAPKDVVYVAASPLANWHRNISLLFPGALSSAIGAARP